MELGLVLHPHGTRDRERQAGVGDERGVQAGLARGVGLGAHLVDLVRRLDVGERRQAFEVAVDPELRGDGRHPLHGLLLRLRVLPRRVRPDGLPDLGVDQGVQDESFAVV